MDIKFEDLSFYYNHNSPLRTLALDHINLTIKEGSFTSIIGQTGSGKSTLIQHLNGLLVPSQGSLEIAGFTLTPKTKKKKLFDLRSKVGVVFQFPENQLYEATVLKDIAVGPINFGFSPEQAFEVAAEMLELVGLPKEIGERFPFSLSGGQMRRVAIAGILAMRPEILVLDEPTAGLDPRAHHEMMELFLQLHHDWQLTTIMVTHQMDDVAKYSDSVVLLDQGRVKAVGTPSEVFKNSDHLEVGYPQALLFAKKLEKKGLKLEKLPLTMDDLVREMVRTLK
jgi:energy-coupling factor transport system ATP-binding protein